MTIRYYYDRRGRLIRELESSDAGEVEKTHEYDLNDNRVSFVLKKDGAVVLSQSYEYDALGRLWKTYDGGGLIAEYGYYDNGNRRYLTLHGLNGQTVTEYGYNGLNLVTSLTNGSYGSYSYAYDIDGNQLSKTETVKGIAKTTSYEYDRAGRLTKETEGGNVISYEYDRHGNRKGMGKIL